MTWPDPITEAREVALGTHKPESAPSRRTSYFAFPTIEECAFYAERENLGESARYYRVRLPQKWRAPMTLTFVPDDLQPYAEAIYKHYWNADDGWQLYEYFGPQMVVLAEYTGRFPPHEHIMNRVIADRTRLRSLAPKW